MKSVTRLQLHEAAKRLAPKVLSYCFFVSLLNLILTICAVIFFALAMSGAKEVVLITDSGLIFYVPTK